MTGQQFSNLKFFPLIFHKMDVKLKLNSKTNFSIVLLTVTFTIATKQIANLNLMKTSWPGIRLSTSLYLKFFSDLLQLSHKTDTVPI